MSPKEQDRLAGLRNLVAEVFVQAARDYRKLRDCGTVKTKVNGAIVVVEVELRKIENFFLGGGADAYIEFLEGLELSGADLWNRLTNSKGNEFTSFVAL